MKFAAPDCGSRKCGIAVRHCILRSRPRPRKGMSNVPERCWNTVLDCLLQGNRSACADRPVDVVAGSKVSAGIFRSIVVEGRKPAEPERVAEAEASSIPSYEAFSRRAVRAGRALFCGAFGQGEEDVLRKIPDEYIFIRDFVAILTKWRNLLSVRLLRITFCCGDPTSGVPGPPLSGLPHSRYPMPSPRLCRIRDRRRSSCARAAV